MGKRGADRQITKDDDSDPEESGAPAQFGTFKRASEEVLATRRIVKVKRTGNSNTSAPNPFASIQMGASGGNIINNSTNVTTSEVVKVLETKEEVAETKVEVAEAKEAVAEAKEEVAQAKDKGKEDEEGEKEGVNGHGKAVVKASENGEEEEEGKTAVTGLTSFQQVSTTPNAFGTFTTSSGFSFSTSTSFKFGSSAGTTAFSFGGSSSSVSAFTFGGSSSAGGFSFSAPALSISSAPSSSSGAEAPPPPPNYATVTLQEIPVETGEEKENAAFTSDAVLYEFVDASWKERGKGELKLNVSEDMKARLLMRSKGNLKLLLNAGLFPDMKTNKMDAKSATFACVNSAGVKDGLTTYALKVRDPGAMSELLDLIEQYKSVRPSSAAPTPATTEENSQPAAAEAEKTEEKAPEDTTDPNEAV